MPLLPHTHTRLGFNHLVLSFRETYVDRHTLSTGRNSEIEITSVSLPGGPGVSLLISGGGVVYQRQLLPVVQTTAALHTFTILHSIQNHNSSALQICSHGSP